MLGAVDTAPNSRHQRDFPLDSSVTRTFVPAVDGLADTWGRTVESDGKTVWAEISG